MKIFIRTLIILLAAGIVVGATYAIAGNQTGNFGGERNFANGTAPRFPEGGRLRPERGGGDHEGSSILAVGELGKSLGIVAIIVVIIAPLSRWLQVWQARRKERLLSDRR